MFVFLKQNHVRRINICGLAQVLLIIELPELCLRVFIFAI